MNLFKKYFVCFTLVTIQSCCLMFVNTYYLVDTYYDFNDLEKKSKAIGLQIGAAIEKNPVFKTYANYTGTNSGYGFFSPNVGSEFVMSFTVLDKEGKFLGTHQKPKSLVQKESQSRFNMCMYPMMERIQLEKPNELFDKYFKVMMHQIAKNVIAFYDTGHTVITDIYIHEYPSISEFLEGENENFVLLERNTFTF